MGNGLLVLTGTVPEWANESVRDGYGSGSGYGYGCGCGDGDGYGYGSGSGYGYEIGRASCRERVSSPV